MMNSLKHNNMMASYTGHRGTVTVGAILDQIPTELFDRLTGAELGVVMDAVNAAYHNGKAALGGIDACDDCLWLPGVGEDGALVPTKAIDSIKITKDDKGTAYAMDYREPRPY